MRFLTILMLIPFQLLGSPGFEMVGPNNSVSFPFRMVNNLIILEAVLNDRETLNMILDTGTRSTILFDRKIIRRLDLEAGREIQFSGIGKSKTVTGRFVHHLSLAFPGIVGNDLTAVVTNQDYLGVRIPGENRIDGVLGYELFMKFIIEIDYPHQRVHFYRQGHYRVPEDYHQIPMEVRNAKPYVIGNLILNDNVAYQENLMVDTGYTLDFLFDLSLPAKKRQPVRLGKGFGGNLVGFHSNIPRVKIQNWYLWDQHALVSTDKSRDLDHGLLGGKVLKKYSLVFNYFDEEMYVKDIYHQDQDVISLYLDP